jgi:hypothetical protein
MYILHMSDGDTVPYHGVLCPVISSPAFMLMF